MSSKATIPAVVWLDELSIDDVPSVGGKNASLGELVRKLGGAGVRVPQGFATTAQAFRDFLAVNDIVSAMQDHIRLYRSGDKTLQDAGHSIRELMLTSSLLEVVKHLIIISLLFFNTLLLSLYTLNKLSHCSWPLYVNTYPT